MKDSEPLAHIDPDRQSEASQAKREASEAKPTAAAFRTRSAIVNPVSAQQISELLSKASSSTVAIGQSQPTVAEQNSSSPIFAMQNEGGVKRPITAESADGIEILVKLAAAGEFDPKNVDIIDVTDKFLKAIAAAPKENLRQSGKILFHASVLLRMKAEALLAAAVQDIDPQDDFLEFDENGSGLIYDSRKEVVGRQITLEDLERALVRRTHTRQNRQRKVTLEQLIEALRQAEKIEKTRSDKKPARAVIELAGQHEARDVDDLLDLAHDEDIEDTIERIERMMADYTTSGDMISLLSLIKLLDGNGDWVDAFLAVLFLSNAGKIVLEQQEFYGPLYLVRAIPDEKASSLA